MTLRKRLSIDAFTSIKTSEENNAVVITKRTGLMAEMPASLSCSPSYELSRVNNGGGAGPCRRA